MGEGRLEERRGAFNRTLNLSVCLLVPPQGVQSRSIIDQTHHTFTQFNIHTSLGFAD